MNEIRMAKRVKAKKKKIIMKLPRVIGFNKRLKTICNSCHCFLIDKML